MSEVALASILNQTISFAIPLLLVALGAMYSERSGIINIAMDGIMIIGALCGCLVLRAMNTAVRLASSSRCCWHLRPSI